MSLPQVRLDDLRWDDLVDLAVRRIPAASEGRWTLHAPVDPGITLLELFAYLLEQRVYFLDQVPDSLVRAFLTLVGEAPKAARPARTVVSFQLRAAASSMTADALFVDAGTILRPEDPGIAHLTLTTRDPLAVLPLTSVAIRELLIDGAYRLTDAVQDRPTLLMPRHGGSGEVGVVLRLQDGAPAGEWASLLCELETSVTAEWTAGAVGGVEPPAVIAFSYSNPAGSRTRFQDGVVQDGTAGLRRSGLIRFMVPEDWAPVRIRPNGNLGHVLWLRTESATHAEPPRLRRMVANCVAALQQERRDLTSDPDSLTYLQRQVRDWIPKSGLALTLPADRRPVLTNDDGIMLELQDARDGWRRWSPVGDVAFFGPGDRVFTVDREQGRLLFGNGLNGAVPTPAKDIRLVLTYSADAEGNIGGSLQWIAEGLPWSSRLEIRNPTPLVGGEQAESVEDARQRVAAELFRAERAVTSEDFEAIVEHLPGIAGHRAHVAAGYDPRLPCAVTADTVTVFVVPRIERGDDFGSDLTDPAATPFPDPGTLTFMRRGLDVARLIGTRVFVMPPRYRSIGLRASVATDLDDRTSLTRPLQTALARYLDALVGGDTKEGWPFGRPLRPSELMRVAQDTVGQDGNVEAIGIALDGRNEFETCDAAAIGPHDLVCLRRFELIRVAGSADTGRGSL